jgi:protein TonB
MPLPKTLQVFLAVIDETVIDEEIEFVFEEPENAENVPSFNVDFKAEEIVPEDTTVYDYPSRYPEFPGGSSAMFSYLGEHLKYTEQARTINLQGTVHVSFVVWKDGSIRDVQILRGLGAGLDEEVIRVIQGMPNWNPGMQHGKNVNVRYRIPVKFSLK